MTKRKWFHEGLMLAFVVVITALGYEWRMVSDAHGHAFMMGVLVGAVTIIGVRVSQDWVDNENNHGP